MADINEQIRSEASGQAASVPAPRQEILAQMPYDPALIEVVELLFFAYRDFICEPDAILAEFGFGRAHHRVLHFVSRYPGLRVADLLVILKITKQSLGRVLKQLVDEGYIDQRAGKADRRERLLYPTAGGVELADRLARPQLERIARSLDGNGDTDISPVRNFLYRMVSEGDRGSVAELLTPVKPGGDGKGNDE